MKKIMMVLVALLMGVGGAPATTVDEIISEFHAEKGVEYQNFSKLTTTMLKPFIRGKVDSDVERLIKGISSVRILNLDDCDDGVRKRFANAVEGFDDKAFETLVSTSDEDDRTRILVKEEGKYIREVVVLTVDEDDGTLVHVKGKLKKKDLQRLINHNK